MAISSKKKMKATTKMRIIFVSLVLMADIIFLPWLIHLPFFAVKNLATAPQDWLQFGILRSIKDVLKNSNYRNLFLVLQMLVLALIISISWNVDKLKKKNRITDGVGGPEPAGQGQFGTSRWQDTQEMDKNAKVWLTDNPPPKKGGIIYGMDQLNKFREKIWFNDEDTHTLIIGATRSGKDRKILQPSIWELAKAGESMVIGDPKGEMYISSKEYLESQGYKVIAMNFREPLKGNQWNILNLVNKAIDEGDTAKATEYAWDIANTMGKLVPYSGGEPIWKNGGESTIASLILLAALESEFKFQRHMTTAYYLLAEYGQQVGDIIPLLEYIKALPTRHPAKAAFATASIAPYKTRASFFTTVLSDLRLFSDPNISDMTSKQDHDFESIGIDKTAVFMIIPDEKNTRNVLATLYVSQVYQSLVNLSNRRGGRIPRRVNVILNEFGNLPQFPDFPTMLTVGGGRGIRFTIAVQDLAQIKVLYKESAQTIQGNCSTWIFLKTADVETAKIISAKTGKYTVETENSSSSVQSKGHSLSHGISTTGRALLMEDEVLRWNIGESLILPTGLFPARYPLPDLSMWKANEDFGFVKPSGDIDNDRELNRQIIEKRWDNIQARNLEEIPIWLPELFTDEDEDEEEEIEIDAREVDPEEDIKSSSNNQVAATTEKEHKIETSKIKEMGLDDILKFAKDDTKSDDEEEDNFL